jgi:hypothetical protein
MSWVLSPDPLSSKTTMTLLTSVPVCHQPVSSTEQSEILAGPSCSGRPISVAAVSASPPIQPHILHASILAFHSSLSHISHSNCQPHPTPSTVTSLTVKGRSQPKYASRLHCCPNQPTSSHLPAASGQCTPALTGSIILSNKHQDSVILFD